MESRLLSHRREAKSRLLHQRLGSVNPLTSILELEASAEDDLDVAASIDVIGALLHERHHWLQCVGTSMGISLSLLIEARSSVTASFLEFESLKCDDVPILQYACDMPIGTVIQRGNIPAVVALWERIECLRRVLNGARISDLKVLYDSQIFPAHKNTSDLVLSILREALKDQDIIQKIDYNWSELSKIDVARSESDRTLTALSESGWSVGARHFMECGARINEAFLCAARSAAPVDLNGMFSGIYGVARKIFYHEFDEPTVTKEIALAYLCDLALSGPNPPVMPFLAYQGMRPSDIFVRAIIALRGFNFASKVDITEPMSVRAFINDIRVHLTAKNELIRYIIKMDNDFAKYVGHLSQEVVSKQIYELNSDGIPNSGSGAGRISYHLATAADASRVRSESPEFFSLPVSYYLNDRTKFHAIFDTIQPPLVRYGNSGIHGTRNIEGWPVYFLMNAISQELCLSVMVDLPDETVSGLLRYVTPFPLSARESVVNLVCTVIHSFFGGSAMGERLAALLRKRTAENLSQ